MVVVSARNTAPAYVIEHAFDVAIDDPFLAEVCRGSLPGTVRVPARQIFSVIA
jgi:hypothetical protein